jgi:hypothetical protein
MEVVVFALVCLVIIALVDGFVLAFDMIGLFIKGVITFIAGGLGLVIGLLVITWGISALILGG